MIYAVRHRYGYSDVGARKGPWKVARVGKAPWQLFNLQEDLGETKDLSQHEPERLRHMVTNVEQWSRTHTEPQWFHVWEEGERWREKNMPQYEMTFRIDYTHHP